MQVRVEGFDHKELRLIRDLLFENQRVVYLEGPIDHDFGPGAARVVYDQILHLNTVSREKPIKLLIDSPGGYLSLAFRLNDMIQAVKAPVWTVCIGTASSGAALVLACGHKGKRFILPSAHVMFHLPEGGATGDSKEVEIQTEFFKGEKNKFLGLLAKYTGKSLKTIIHDTDRLHFLNAEKAKSYGFVDEVVTDLGEIISA